MNFGTKRSRGRTRHLLLAMSVVVGLAACAESASKDTAPSESVAQTKTKNAALVTCTFDTKCAIGSTGIAGGTVIYNAPSSFNCGPTSPIQLRCNFLEIAKGDWVRGFVGSASAELMSYCPTNGTPIDLRCTWSATDGPQAMTTKAELGASKKNFEAVKASLRDVNLEAPAVAAPFLYTSLGALPGVEANPFGLPSLDELMVVCNYANGSPMRTDGCTPGTLRSDFQADWYWSSTIAGADTGQPVYAVNFKTGQVQKLARKVYAYIRPIRTFYSTLDTTVVTTVPVVTMPPTTVAPTTVPPTTVATTVPPTTTATTLPPTTLAVTTLPPTTVVRTTLPPTTAVRTTVAPSTTAATAVTKACTPSSPCKPGDVMPDGSTVFYYSPTPFNCDWQLSATGRKCNMLAYAHFNWYDKAIVNFGGPGPCRPPSEFMSDPTCTWNTGESKPDLTFATKPEIGMGAYNRLQTTKYFTDRGEISIADFVKSYNGEDGTTTGFELPTRGELYLLCNWLMNTPLSTTKCGFNSNRKENANRFAHYAYWSSTFQFTPGYSGTCPFTLSPWFILDYPQCRGARQRVRPFRAFRGFVDPSYVPPTTIP